MDTIDRVASLLFSGNTKYVKKCLRGGGGYGCHLRCSTLAFEQLGAGQEDVQPLDVTYKNENLSFIVTCESNWAIFLINSMWRGGSFINNTVRDLFNSVVIDI